MPFEREAGIFAWDHLQSFLAVARQGNLSSAARALGVTQSTMGRRLDALHLRSGVRLLQKTPDGYVLTPAGERVLASAERMEAEVLSIERAVAGEDERIAGEVRITTVEAFGSSVISPMLVPLLRSQPGLQIELITDYRTLSLSRREADIAIRLAEFEQQEAIVTRVGGMTFGLFASHDYLSRQGVPEAGTWAGEHTLVTCQRDLALKAESTRLLEALPGATVVFRANSRYAQLEATRAGLGLGMLPCFLAHGSADLVELPIRDGPVVRELWLGVHRDTVRSRRIRTVVDHLTRELRSWSGRAPLAPVEAVAVA